MKIDQLMHDPGAPLFYNPDFRRMVETHLVWLRSLSSENRLQIDPAKAYKYTADFYGLLQEEAIQAQHHWITLRLNNYTAPTDYLGDRLEIIVPDLTAVERLVRAFSTVPRKING